MTLRPSVQFRGYESPVNESPVQTYSLTATGRRYELSGGADFPCLRMALAGRNAGADARRKGRLLGALRHREAPRVSSDRIALEPWLLPSGSDAGRERDAHRLDRVVGSHRGALAGGRSPTPSSSVAEAFSAWHRRSRDDPFAGAARAGSRPVHHHAGRAGGGSGERSSGGGGGPHRHCRLPLVHRLGPRHDDQPRGADASRRAGCGRRRTSCGRSRTTSATG